MKLLFISLFAVSVILSSCGNNAPAEQKAEQQAPATTATEAEQVKVVKPQFADADAGVKAYAKTVTAQYLLIKNALTSGNAAEAGNAAKSMAETVKTFDKSLLTTPQKAIYDQKEAGLKNYTDLIAKSTSNIETQREHFSMLSQDMYVLVSNFGGGQPIYHDYCPMAKNDKGAYWLSETKEIKNPYFGDKMMECGSVEEEIQ